MTRLILFNRNLVVLAYHHRQLVIPANLQTLRGQQRAEAYKLSGTCPKTQQFWHTSAVLAKLWKEGSEPGIL
jgi:hypothetical protein